VSSVVFRDTAKPAQFKVGDRALQRLRTRTAKFAALFSSTDEAMLRSEGRSRSAYYSVIAGAVSKLPNNTREARLALYDRAEIALAAELLQNPEVSDEQVAIERLALERAIHRVEDDARRNEQATIGDVQKRRWSLSPFRTFLGVFGH